MTRLRLAVLVGACAPFLAAPAVHAQRAEERGCSVCHGTEARGMTQGVHAAVGVTCTTCHGGTDGTNDQDVAHGEELRPLREPRAAVESCARCHSDVERMRGFGLSTDQLALYRTSAHGQRLFEDGDPNVATCVDCHGAHGVRSAEDPRSPVHPLSQVETCGECHADAGLMEPYGLDTEVVGGFRDSVHGVALHRDNVLTSPSCTDCHGSHGATPPRVTELGRVCGNCHPLVQGYFEESPHAEPARQGVIEECVSCHGAHRVRAPAASMLAGEGRGNCGTCHRGDSDRGAVVAGELHAVVTDLDERIANAHAEIRAAAERGLFLGSHEGYLRDARDLRARSRALTHTLAVDRLDDLANRARAMIEQTHESLDLRERALRDRRIFTGIFLAVALLLTSVLQTYRREAFGRWKRPAPVPEEER